MPWATPSISTWALPWLGPSAATSAMLLPVKASETAAPWAVVLCWSSPPGVPAALQLPV